MSQRVQLDLSLEELDFIAKMLQQVAYGVVAQANMGHLLPTIAQQANECIARQQQEGVLASKGVEEALS